jgi:hypothetical protein
MLLCTAVVGLTQTADKLGLGQRVVAVCVHGTEELTVPLCMHAKVSDDGCIPSWDNRRTTYPSPRRACGEGRGTDRRQGKTHHQDQELIEIDVAVVVCIVTKGNTIGD